MAASITPMVAPILSRATVTALSSITCEGVRKPLPAPGSMSTRNSGAARNSLVTGSTVTEGCAAKKSDWITSAGRGLP